jgi:hypothetical protein
VGALRANISEHFHSRAIIFEHSRQQPCTVTQAVTFRVEKQVEKREGYLQVEETCC